MTIYYNHNENLKMIELDNAKDLGTPGRTGVQPGLVHLLKLFKFTEVNPDHLNYMKNINTIRPDNDE